MSVRFHLGDPRFKRFMSLIAEGFKLFGRMTYVNFIPIMRYLPGLQKTRKKIAEVSLIFINILLRNNFTLIEYICRGFTPNERSF